MNTNDNKIFDFCLLIPCYNNFEGLIESLKSVLYPDDKYLILIIDDGSNHPLDEGEIKTCVGSMKPVIVLHNKKNLGITKTLNNGLSWIEENTSSKYIARLDCGDICTPNRFTTQVGYMDLHSEIGLLGSWCRFEDKKKEEEYLYVTPVRHNKIQRAMYFRNVFIHPTVMFRTSLLEQTGYYPENFTYAEDYAFFWKLITMSKSYVIDEFLVTCEININGISFKKKTEQIIARYKVVKKFSKSKLLRAISFFKLSLLYIMPKRLILQLKKII